MGVRIEICGGIATGKTTLAKLLAQESDASLVLENFRSNPFWERFYLHPELFAYEKNVCFLAQHTGEIKAFTDSYLTICDYGVRQDLAYASLTGNRDHTAVMKTLYDHLYASLPPLTMLVQLRCDEKVQLARIRSRGRKEEDPITIQYLESLNRALDYVLEPGSSKARFRVIHSDSVDFAHDRQQALELKRDLLASVAD